MNKRQFLKDLVAGKINLSNVPPVGPCRLLIKTELTGFTDSITGEKFTSEDVEKMKAPFSDSQFSEGYIYSGTPFTEYDDVHPLARTPYFEKTDIEGRECYRFLMINIPAVDAENRLFFLQPKA